MQNMKRIFLAALLAGIFSGCADEEPEGKETRDVTVQMNVGTRAAHPDGTAFESLRVYVFSAAGERIGYKQFTGEEIAAGSCLVDIKQVVVGGEQTMTYYLVADEGAVTMNNRPLNFRETMTAGELDDIAFGLVVNNNKLPMVCKDSRTLSMDDYEENTVPGHEGHWLVRDNTPFLLKYPCGKLELYFAKGPNVTADGLVVRSATLLRAGLLEKNYVFPPEPGKLQDIPSFGTDMPVELLNEGKVTKSLAARTTDAGDYDLMNDNVFLFENNRGSQNPDVQGDAGGNVVRVVYSVNGGTEKTKDIYLPPVERGRNYRVFCWVDYRGVIEIAYSVLPWNAEDVYELDGGAHPTYSSAPYTEGDYSTDVWYSDVEVNYPYQREGSVTFVFDMQSNHSWTPTLVGGGNKFEMAVMRRDDNEVMPSGALPKGTYYITVWPTDQSGEGDEVSLQVTSRSLTGEFEPLLINPERKWPAPADSQSGITIKRVSQQP